MLELFTNKRSIAGFFSGVGTLFVIFSVLLMSPENMWRWILKSTPNDVKVNLALSEPSEEISILKKEINKLKTKLITEQSKNSNIVNELNKTNSQLSKMVLQLETDKKKAIEEKGLVNSKLKILNQELSAMNMSSMPDERLELSATEMILGLFDKGEVLILKGGPLKNVASSNNNIASADFSDDGEIAIIKANKTGKAKITFSNHNGKTSTLMVEVKRW